MTDMGRPKTRWRDLPPRMSARRLKGGTTWYYYQARGKKIPLGADLNAARTEWASLECGAVLAGDFPAIAALYAKATLRGLAASTQAHYKIALRNLVDAFPRHRLEEIAPSDVREYLQRRTKKGAALLEKRVLSALWNWARGAGHTNLANPATGVNYTPAERKAAGIGRRVRYVSDTEFANVRARAEPAIGDAMDLALLTGQRPSDLLPLTRHDIRDGVLWISQVKTGTRVGIRVEGELKSVLDAILTRARRVPSMQIIADAKGQRLTYQRLRAGFARARGDADWQFRDLRAKAATDSGDLKQAQQLLGHASEATTAGVYRRLKGHVVGPLK